MSAPFPNGQNPESDVDLIRRLLDGRISEEELQGIQSRLQTDTSFRDHYIQLVDLESALYEECSVPNSNAHSSAILQLKTQQTATNRKTVIAITVSVVCLILVISFVLSPWYSRTVPNDQHLTLPSNQETPKSKREEELSNSLLPKSEPAPDIAILTQVSGIDSDDLKIGRCFKAGTLKIPQGQIKLEFFSGALITIVGPAEIEMISKSAATLRSGRATALIPESAIGFVINAPESAVVDLGTEIGIQVEKHAPVEAKRLKSQAKLPLAGNEESSIASNRSNPSSGDRLDKNKMALPNKLDASTNSLKIVETPSLALTVRQGYIDAIKQARPLVYWRFEAEEHGQVRNEMSPQWAADVIRNINEPNGLRIVDGHAQFKKSKAPRMIMSADPFPQWNEGPFSIEFWLRADRLSHMTCVSVIQETDVVGIQHLNVIEIMAKQYLSNLKHDIGNLRFLQRDPPCADGKTGVNLFSRERCTHGQWMQVVVVKKHDMLELYLDGLIARRVFLNVASDSSTYKLYLGQLRIVNTLRQFIGGIDEFAFYKRALSPEEIDNHFRLMFW
ncbi:LamG-like jellyroll fold domain-containing protein [uncultured Gimesia sp.]|uniref:LamG-like jellyroll fold domain-containing protein n=1 Tax=uncultured Gimesia sp. TaxID=1678688 RepID=UPI0030D7B31C|tara:strand:- start:32639 stop:34318 length:1680 start_codon:yes stop_codon:yes gene_type:complete